MPQAPAYSLDDWNAMLTGSYVKLTTGSILRVSHVDRADGVFILIGHKLEWRDNQHSPRTAAHSVSFTEDNFEEHFDWGRQPGRIVSLTDGTLLVARPSVRRTRVKGNHPNDWSMTYLCDGRNIGRMSEFDSSAVNFMMMQIFGLAEPHEDVRRRGSFAMVERNTRVQKARFIGDAAGVPDDALNVVRALAAGLGQADLNANLQGMDVITLRKLGTILGLTEGKAVFMLESAIGTVRENTIHIDERADALVDVVRREFDDYQVVVGGN